MNYNFVVNRATDISLAQILYYTKPNNINLRIVATAFNHHSEYVWEKPKSLQLWLKTEDINWLRDFFGRQFVLCKNSKDLRNQFKNNEIGIFPGREPFIFKNLCQQMICISSVRDYFSRYLDLLAMSQIDIKIFLNSSKWVDKKLCGMFGMGTKENYTQDYDFLKKHLNSIHFSDPYNDYISILDKIGKRNIKEKHNIPLNKKVVLVSLRRGDFNLTFHRSDEDFFNSTINSLKTLKRKGYFIIGRRRRSVDDIVNRRRDSSENTRYQEYSKYIDYDMSGWEGFPSKIWQACYIADFMLLSDMSGIVRREGSICKTPILLVDYDKNTYDENLKTWDPAMKKLHADGLLSKNIDYILSEEYKNSMTRYNAEWHEGNCKNFWKYTLM